jgi:inorganic pyrophosphatase
MWLTMGVLAISRFPPFDSDSGALNVIIETPKGRRTKFKYDEKSGLFKLDKMVPAGFAFPFDFGFLPSTLGEDGGPLDVVVLTKEPTFTGCLVLGRLLGILEAEQSDKEKTTRNDRLIAIPINAKPHKPEGSSARLDDKLASSIQAFFVAYDDAQGKKFKPLGIHGPDRALRIIREGVVRARKKRRK